MATDTDKEKAYKKCQFVAVKHQTWKIRQDEFGNVRRCPAEEDQHRGLQVDNLVYDVDGKTCWYLHSKDVSICQRFRGIPKRATPVLKSRYESYKAYVERQKGK